MPPTVGIALSCGGQSAGVDVASLRAEYTDRISVPPYGIDGDSDGHTCECDDLWGFEVHGEVEGVHPLHRCAITMLGRRVGEAVWRDCEYIYVRW